MTVTPADISVAQGEHVVQFYESELELVRTVGRYLGDTIAGGGAAIVIATEAHRRAFDSYLESQGIEPARCRQDGTLTELDAATTLSAFARDGRVDHAAFRRVVGPVVRQAGATGRTVRAYGEMVALLWDAGNVVAAIELEECWNELFGVLPFSLCCGYPSESVRGDEQAGALARVCSLHTSVVCAPGPEAADARHPAGLEASAQFSARSDALRCARQFVADVLDRWGHGGALIENAELVVSELATNAVVHTRSPFRVTAEAQAGSIRLSVRDASAAKPRLVDRGRLGPSGRGLRLVAALASNWGVEWAADGKVVWAELPT